MADQHPDKDMPCQSRVTIAVEIGPYRRTASREITDSMFHTMGEGSIAQVVIDLMKEATDKVHRAVDGHPRPCRRRKRR